ncbi:hypothetical protein CARUB_v10006794mg [Capsella rubella]|uniref:Uncharacterized protein n=1 Tax=Capsella rubella TaxID=81985 RepID=R0GG62_9BRAS|nr:uncharacterized protein LOC17878007 [Capsella rubella]EOA15749.1 hypothetical protein CARUB_v10006794mg [Capsella rubella]
MVTKRRDAVEIITSDPWVTKKKTKSKSRKKLSKEVEDDGTPLSGIFCLKKRQDMKTFDEKEDCFILDFDPNDAFDAKNRSDSTESDEDVAIIHEKGQVACRDFPHPRHLCLKFPFGSSQHKSHCNKCYCYVCDLAAPCAHWTATLTPHCEALENSKWKPLRELFRNRGVHRATTNK